MFILYVGRDNALQRLDVGSILCVNLLQTLDQTIHVEECSARTPRKPIWLIGTPTLYDETTGDVLRGNEAVTFLQGMALRDAEQRGVGRAEGSAEATPGRARVVAPGVQLRPEQSPRSLNDPGRLSEGQEEGREDGGVGEQNRGGRGGRGGLHDGVKKIEE